MAISKQEKGGHAFRYTVPWVYVCVFVHAGREQSVNLVLPCFSLMWVKTSLQSQC